jgi:hypothetical protein
MKNKDQRVFIGEGVAVAMDRLLGYFLAVTVLLGLVLTTVTWIASACLEFLHSINN